MNRVTVVVGGQYGSEAKGAVVGHLSRKLTEDDVVIRVAGPNAGHTVYDVADRRWALRAVPVAAATNGQCQLLIGPGSEIDLEVLSRELESLDDAGHRASQRLRIHPSATILTPEDVKAEGRSGIVGRIGSTGKGIGAARAARINRTAPTAADVGSLRAFLCEPGPFRPSPKLNQHVIVEGTQGYGLGLHHRNYPQVTSSDCRAIDFLGMAGITPWDPAIELVEVVVVVRVYPIRVAGNSGPLKDETTWANLGLPEERTTVTNKVRRVGRWDDELVAEAIAANGGGDWSEVVTLAVTMLDQMFPQIKGVTDLRTIGNLPAVARWLNDLEERHQIQIRLIGTGPQSMTEVEL